MTRPERIERAFAVPMMVAALLVIPLLALENAHLGSPWPTLLRAADWAIWSAFLLEAVTMLAVVEDRGAWLRDHPLEVVTVLFTVPVLSTTFDALRALRLLRLLRLFRLARLARLAFSMEGLRYVVLLVALTVIAGGEAFSQLEGTSLFNSLYWAATTVTTVGYGDIAPHTDGGKVLAVAVMVVGIGFVAILTGAVADRFIGADAERAREAQAPETADIRAELREISERLARLQSRL